MLNAYQRYIALSRYARYLPEQQRRETWEETVSRYCEFFGGIDNSFPKEKIYDLIMNNGFEIFHIEKQRDGQIVGGYDLAIFRKIKTLTSVIMKLRQISLQKLTISSMLTIGILVIRFTSVN